MKKKRYRFVVPTTKKQWKILGIVGIIYLVISISYFLISSFFDEPPVYISIIFIILFFGNLFTGLVLVLKDNSKVVRGLRNDIDKEYDEANKCEDIINAFVENIDKFDYSKASKEERLKMLVVMLHQCAVYSRTSLDFYIECHEYSMEEIKELLSTLPITKVFSSYLENVVLKGSTSKEIGSFVIELNGLLNYVFFKKPVDPLLDSPKAKYNIYRNVRSYYYYDVLKGKYGVNFEVYADRCGYLKWEKIITTRYFKTEESAIKKVEKNINRIQRKDPTFYDVEKLDIQDMRQKISYFKYLKNTLEEPYYSVAKYLDIIGNNGHYRLFNEYEEFVENSLKNLEKLFPTFFYEMYYNTYVFKYSMERCNRMDEYYNEHFTELVNVLNEHAKTLDINILK